ncbi:amidase [Limnoglobus roseus]|uniref:Amidase n=1 Tax=Limnoglobus roseus TaxID=2598579 RepID=A0A5C1ARN6_9BACT|nr:amidase [Limnoglobus roseus]QEL19528.1 amidase [Limnoglobus roseus]
MPDEPLTISAAAPLIRTGELTPSELLEQCLRRIDIYEPAVQAWVYLDRQRARREAERLTDAVKKGDYRGPLHGIPIGVKDIIDVFDMPTGCGSKLWANSYARRDATVVERLRAAGALILGKTVTTPFAFTDPPKTRNPWNLDRTPGGSSSGSAAAVACGMCLGALGTQTGGSLTRPASYCGVCSLKPSYGRVSVEGVLPLAPDLDHVGVMANCVRDLAILFEVIAAPVLACTSLVDSGPDQVELYQLHDYFDAAEPDLLEIYRTATRAIEPPEVRQLKLPTGFSEIPSAHLTTMSVGAASVHAERLNRHGDDYPPRIRELIQQGLMSTAIDLSNASRLRIQLRRQFKKALKEFTVLMTPATSDLPPSLETTGRPVFNFPWSFLEYPTVSVPAGRSEVGLPVSIQLIAGDNNEPHLLASAAWAERCFAFPHRLPPVPA